MVKMLGIWMLYWIKTNIISYVDKFFSPGQGKYAFKYYYHFAMWWFSHRSSTQYTENIERRQFTNQFYLIIKGSVRLITCQNGTRQSHDTKQKLYFKENVDLVADRKKITKSNNGKG